MTGKLPYIVTGGHRFPTVPAEQVNYMDVSPKQVISVATALLPFLERTDNGVIVGPQATPGAPWSPGTTPTSWVPGSSMHSTSVSGTNQGMNVQTAGTGTTDTDGAGLGAVALTGAGLLAATGLVLRRRFSAQN